MGSWWSSLFGHTTTPPMTMTMTTTPLVLPIVTSAPFAPATTPIPTAAPFSALNAPSATFYTGRGGTGDATILTSVNDLMTYHKQPLSVSVANGGSFSLVATFSDGLAFNWSAPAGTTGAVDAPTAPPGNRTVTHGVYTLNGQSIQIP